MVDRQHGVLIVSHEPQVDELSGVLTTDAATALGRMVAALNMLMRKSSFSEARIRELVAAGNPNLIYDATIPKDVNSTVKIAVYIPRYYDPASGKRDFVVGIGRTGILWDVEEIAPFIAHEFAGHAYQHLKGRLYPDRELDIECEAYLVQEQATQDLGLDKLSREQVILRRALENRWCDDFRRYTLRVGGPAALEWDKRDPDVPLLLDAFLTYLEGESK